MHRSLPATETSSSNGGMLSRRGLLTGGLGLVLLSACGSSGSAAQRKSGDTAESSNDPALMAFFDANSELSTGSRQRAVVGIGDMSGALLEDTPASLAFVVAGGGAQQRLEVARHNEGLPHAYYPVDFTPTTPGTYTITTTYKGHKLSTTLTVGSTSALPAVGTAMPKIATPTTDDARGVDPICTRDPQCPLHAVSLDHALTLGKPVAFLISTPKFCQVAICGPVLDVLMAEQSTYADRITFIHQEVYANGKEAAEKGNAAKLAPAVEELKLPFEPMLILIDKAGNIAERLDHVYDRSELRAALDRVVA